MATLSDILSDDPGPFLQWVKSHYPDEYLGYPNTSTACPIRTFIRDRVDVRCHVRSDEVTDMDGNHLIELPQWARNFIRVADGDLHTRLTTENVRYLLGMLGYSSHQFR